jgi:hypothetical protein
MKKPGSMSKLDKFLLGLGLTRTLCAHLDDKVPLLKSPRYTHNPMAPASAGQGRCVPPPANQRIEQTFAQKWPASNGG